MAKPKEVYEFHDRMQQLQWKLDRLVTEKLGGSYWVDSSYDMDIYDRVTFKVVASSVPGHPGTNIPYTPMEIEFIEYAKRSGVIEEDWLHSIANLDSGTYMVCGYIKNDGEYPIALRRYSVRFVEGSQVEWFETNSWLRLKPEQLRLLYDKGVIVPASQHELALGQQARLASRQGQQGQQES